MSSRLKILALLLALLGIVSLTGCPSGQHSETDGEPAQDSQTAEQRTESGAEPEPGAGGETQAETPDTGDEAEGDGTGSGSPGGDTATSSSPASGTLGWLNEKVKQNPEDVRYRRLRATVARNREPETAIGDYQRLTELEPQNPRYPRNALQLIRRHRGMESARQWVSEQLEQYPERGVFHELEGDLLRDSYRYEQALEKYARAVELNPDLYLARTARIELLDRMGRTREARALVERYQERAGDSAKELSRVGSLWEGLGETEKALDFYDRAIEQAPETRPLYPMRAGARAASGDLDGALEDYREVLELDAQERQRAVNKRQVSQVQGVAPDVLRAIAEPVLDGGRAQALLEVVNNHLNRTGKETQSSPDRLTLQFYKARCLDELGRSETARKLRNNIRETNRSLYYRLHTRSLERRGRLSTAADTWREYREEHGATLDKFQQEARLRFLAGNYESALEVADAALEEYPDNARLHWLRGLTLAELGRQEEAQSARDRASEINPRIGEALYWENLRRHGNTGG